MAGSGRGKDQQALKNQAMLVVRNATKQEVTNVIFPNGITVGVDNRFFGNGFRVHGNAQISGIVNAQGYRINGQDLQTSGGEFLFLDVDLNAVPIDLGPDAPNHIQVNITQSGQSETITSSDVSVFKTGGTPAGLTTLAITETTGPGNSFSSGSFDISSIRSAADYPITVKVEKGTRTSVKKIFSVENGNNGTDGTDGTDGTNGATTLIHQFTYDYSSAVQSVAGTVQLPSHSLTNLAEGFMHPPTTFGSGHTNSIEGITGVGSYQNTISPSNPLSNMLFIPSLSGATGTIINITGTATQASISAGTGSAFYIILYQTNDTIGNSPTKLEYLSHLLIGSSLTTSWSSSATHVLTPSGNITIRDKRGLAFGVYTVTNTTPTAGTLNVNLQISYTGM